MLALVSARRIKPKYNPHLDAVVEALPREPGVYFFKDANGRILYIGKAKSLRDRVRSYFRGHDERPKVPRMLAQVDQIDILIAGSELDALRLEDDLIKRHLPPFNVRLRDEKSYPYIAVTLGDEYPRVILTRDRGRRGDRYFGPYASSRKVRETLDILNRIFPYRPCEGPKPGRHSGIPCLDYHLERCAAPCVGYISKEDYRAVIDEVIKFLSGEIEPVLATLHEKMKVAASEERYELAARYRDSIDTLRRLSDEMTVEPRSLEDFDVLGFACEEDEAVAQLLTFRSGRLTERQQFALERVGVDGLDALVETICLNYYERADDTPPLVIVPAEATPSPALSEVLATRRGGKVEVRAPQRGEKLRLVELAAKNAKLTLERRRKGDALQEQRRLRALEELREQLNLERLPGRIECYDISNLGESSPVGVMVVFEDGEPKKAHYRKFGIDPSEGQDDFRMMNEVLDRRFYRFSRANDDSFSQEPDLIVIDGGKGQLAAAIAALRKHGLQRVPVISLAKQQEEIFLPGSAESVRLPAHSPALLLLRRVRDETHRFAITFHRKRRDKQALQSVFDELPGVGPKRKAALRARFDTAHKLRDASVEEIAEVVGSAVAARVHAFLHEPAEAPATGTTEDSAPEKA